MRRALVAAAVGLLLGAVDLAWLQWVPPPWSDLGDSGAVWALVAWAVAVRGPATARVRVVAAVLVLVGAVASYHVVGALVLGGPADLVDPGALIYLGYAVVCGALVGVGAATWRGAGPARWRAVGLAAVPALLVGEAWLRADLLDPVRRPVAGTLVVPLLLVLAAVAMLLAGRRDRPVAALAAGLVPPLSAACVATWAVAGIGGV